MPNRNVSEERASLIERNKELTCLYQIARIVAHAEKTVSEVLREIVAVLPPAFYYPDKACARIRLDDMCFVTEPFEESCHLIRQFLTIEGRERGAIEVYYMDAAATGSASSHRFLPEEQDLLQTIAQQSALMIEIKLANEKKKELENQLRHADRLAKIGQLTSGMAHELNEPLSGILGFAQLALKKIESPETATRYLDKIIQSCLHARDIIRKMMLFGSPLPPKMEKVNLNDLVSEGLAFITPRFADSGVQFEKALSTVPPMVKGDAAQITQVLANLVINAIHAMPEGGKLAIKTGVTENTALLIVQDTGIGMDEKTIEQIFLPFFTTKDVDMGTGLGLCVVHGIVSAHGGTIDVASKKGRGTVFTIHFPLDNAE
jgi:signal transduction histidine kinase